MTRLAILFAALAMLGTAIGQARAGSCHTHCYNIGNQQYCDTSCY